MKKVLVVVDMQNDFISGSLGSEDARRIVDGVVAKIKASAADSIYVTLDSHTSGYLDTAEGRTLPVEHCIKGSWGWELHDKVRAALAEKAASAALTEMVNIEKPNFGSYELAERIYSRYPDDVQLEIELVGLCTDICVVTNALLIKTKMPEARVTVDAACCAGVTPESHEAALLTMSKCHIGIAGQ